tara:strand:- start:304 stop:1218 length:915 start_codon:yes stop_codon:yes gene_type:complete
MTKKLVIRLSNNLGNQMFMYASAFAMSKRLNRQLFIDDETAYSGRKNIHKFDLDKLSISAQQAPSNLKFLGSVGYFKRKTLKYLDKLQNKKRFYTEHRDNNKFTSFDNNLVNGNYNDLLFVEGHFETEKYFSTFSSDIKKEFKFKYLNNFENNSFLKEIKNSESVSICVRQNRFSERKRAITNEDEKNSNIFTKDQINFIHKAVEIIKSKVDNPKFFLWSNDYHNLDNFFPNNLYTFVSTNKIDLDLYLMSQSKHHIVIPSSFNWWGAWLGCSKNSLIIRPSVNHFSNFNLNNKDFWPVSWTIV